MGAPIDISGMIYEASGHLQGCPAPVIENSYRKIITDLCQRAKVWRVDLDAITMVVSQEGYTLVSPVAYAEPLDVLEAYNVIATRRQDMRWLPLALLRTKVPAGEEGTPRLFHSGAGTTLTVAPAPDTAGDLHVQCCLRPTPTATQWDTDLYNEFRRCLLHGVLHDLMSMPNRGWSSAKDAIFHGKMWTDLVSDARWRADSGYTRQALRVEARPFA